MRAKRATWIMSAGTAVLGIAGYGMAQTAPSPIGSPKLPYEFRAYLADSGVRREGYVIAPATGSAADMLDRATFRATRTLAGSPRWALAQADAGRGILKAFSCAAGTALTNDTVPALTTLLSRYRTDMIAVTRQPAAGAGPTRPYARDTGPVCLADKPLAMASGTPAIQSAWGWTVGLILSEALPERTDAILRRARAYGESAAICGFASASEVAGGRDLASALYARMRAQPEFAGDLARAVAQIAAAARAGGTAPESCEAEHELTAPAF